MPGLHSKPDPRTTLPPSYRQSSSSDRYSPDAYRSSDDFNVIEPQALHQVPYLDEKPLAWSRNKDRSARDESPYKDTYWNEKRGSPPRILNGDRYGPQDGTEFQFISRHAHAYRDRRYSRPLLEYVRNEWRNDLYADSSPSSPTLSDLETPSLLQILSAPRFRRYAIEFLAIMSFLTFAWTIWIGWIEPVRLENKALNESLNETMREGQMLFGHNLTPAFLGMVQLKTLDKELLPQQGNGKRLVMVGDVHGCHDELVHLLSKVSFSPQTDHLLFTGDLISKGPSSPLVVDLAISLNASCVRGNHEDRILLAHRDTVSHPLTLPGLSRHEAVHDDPNKNPYLSQKNSDESLAQTLTKDQITYLSSCPLILTLGALPHLGPTHLVHAGLVPGLSLESQDPTAVMNMRTIDLKTHVPSSGSKGVPWAKLWDRYQTLLPKGKRATVVFGHDSRRGLQMGKYSNGLDSGCVAGGKLTALVIEGAGGGKKAKGKGVRKVSVRCKNHLKKKWGW